MTVYLALVDFQKAFDSVDHSFMLEVLHKDEVQKKYLSILAKIYKKSTTRVVLVRVGQTFKLQ